MNRAEIPYAKGKPVLGMLPLLKRDPLSFFTNLEGAMGPLVRVNLGLGQELTLVSDPHAVRHIQHGQANFFGKSKYHAALSDVFGTNTILANGQDWMRRRRSIQPPFSAQAQPRLQPFIDGFTERLRYRFSASAAHGHAFDVCNLILEEGLRSTLKMILGVKDEEAGPFLTDLSVMLTLAEKRLWALAPVPLSIPTPENRKLLNARSRFRKTVLQLIAQSSETEHTGAVLKHLQEAGLTDSEIVDELGGLIAASFETTAIAVSWALSLLSQYPYWRDAVRADTSDAPNLATAVIHEAMRLYPPVWIFSRQAFEDCRIEGSVDFDVKAGDVLAIAPWVIHRSARLWENPLGFDPERFLDGPPTGQDQYRYIPFAGGARRCVGERLGLAQASQALSAIVKGWDINLVPGSPVTPSPTITLRPSNGVWVTATPAAAHTTFAYAGAAE